MKELTIEEQAAKENLSIDDFIAIEAAKLDLSVDEYRQAIGKEKKVLAKRILPKQAPELQDFANLDEDPLFN